MAFQLGLFATQNAAAQMPVISNGQKFGFFSQAPVLMPPAIRPINFNINKDTPLPMMNAPIPRAPFPTTTVFVGNITELCSDELMQKILKLCGPITNWKRLQDTNGKFKAFGFCDFFCPEGTLRALRILNKFQLGNKKLNVKTDEATSKMLDDFVKKKKEIESITEGKNPNESDEKIDNEIATKIRELIKEENTELFAASESAKNEDYSDEEKSHRSKKNRKRSRSYSLTSKEDKELTSSPKTRRRSPSGSSKRRSNTPSRKSDRNIKSPKKNESKRKKRKQDDSSSESSSDSSTSSSSDASHLSESKKKHSKKYYSQQRHSRRSRTRSSADEDSDEIEEKRRLRHEIKRKEQSYLKRLAKWEERERRMAKQYEKDEQDEIQRKKMLQREAKKLRQFLEDYEDERDDIKYYRSSSLFQRRKNYEREREADAKDRQEELQEIEELKKQILAENVNVVDADAEAKKLHEAKGKEKLKSIRSHSGSPTPHRPLGQPLNNNVLSKEESTDQNENEEDWDENESAQNDASGEKIDTNGKKNTNQIRKGSFILASENGSMASFSSTSISIQNKSGSKLIATLQKPTISRPNGVFGDDDDEDEQVSKKKIKPFEITREDRIQSMTPEERKKLIKDLIERIPTSKDELFKFSICWEFVNESLVEKRVKPWINKKICEYIGDEEPSLVSFICEKITSRTEPIKILGDLAMVLDDEAEVFMIKLWRLIIYESEAKKLGLNGGTNTSTTIGNNNSGGESTGKT